MDNEFICPECGLKEAGEQMMVSKEPPTGKSKKDPWQVSYNKRNAHPVKLLFQII